MDDARNNDYDEHVSDDENSNDRFRGQIGEEFEHFYLSVVGCC